MINKKEYYFFNTEETYYIFKVLDISRKNGAYADIFLSSKTLYVNKKNDTLAELKFMEGSEIWRNSVPAKTKLLEIFRYIFETDLAKIVGTYDQADFRGIE